MSHVEHCGKDTLIVIYEEPQARHGMSGAVVRWCYKCGAVVVDIDYDGRTNPGAFMHMKFPQNYFKS